MLAVLGINDLKFAPETSLASNEVPNVDEQFNRH